MVAFGSGACWDSASLCFRHNDSRSGRCMVPEKSRMKLLLVHNYYQQAGGEDVVFEAEGRLLEDHGHRVIRYTARNEDVEQLSRPRLAGKAIWNAAAYREVARLLEQERP